MMLLAPAGHGEPSEMFGIVILKYGKNYKYTYFDYLYALNALYLVLLFLV